jgi:hypothetical protein
VADIPPRGNLVVVGHGLVVVGWEWNGSLNSTLRKNFTNHHFVLEKLKYSLHIILGYTGCYRFFNLAFKIFVHHRSEQISGRVSCG